jgi:hypothetical protein
MRHWKGLERKANRPETKMRTVTFGSFMLKITPGKTSGSYLQQYIIRARTRHFK